MKQDDRSPHSPWNYFMMLEERAGRAAATALCAVLLWFSLTHTAVFARLWAELLRAYLAPGAMITVLCVLPFLAGLIYLRKGRGFYVRAGRALEIVLSGLSIVLVGLLGDRVPIEWLQDGAAHSSGLDAVFPVTDSGRWEFAAAMFLLSGLLFVVAGGIRCVRAAYDYLYPLCVEFYRKKALHAVRERVSGFPQKVSGIFGADAGGDTDADAGPERSAQENGMITETVKLYGTEFADELSAPLDGRKAKFFGIKTMKKLSGLPHADRISRYGERIVGELTAVRIWWWAALLVIYVLTVGFANAFAAVTFYRAYDLQILIPVILSLFAVAAAAVRGRWAAAYREACARDMDSPE